MKVEHSVNQKKKKSNIVEKVHNGILMMSHSNKLMNSLNTYKDFLSLLLFPLF